MAHVGKAPWREREAILRKEFTVHWRNPGHWDVCQPLTGRAFTIRGEPGRVLLTDERAPPYQTDKFQSVSAAILWVVDRLMDES